MLTDLTPASSFGSTLVIWPALMSLNLYGCHQTCMDVVKPIWLLLNLYGHYQICMAIIELIEVTGAWNSRHGSGGADGECCGGLVIVSGKLRRDQ